MHQAPKTDMKHSEKIYAKYCFFTRYLCVIICNRNTEEYKSIMFYPEVGEINAHAQTVCTRPSPPILEGLGMRLVKFHTQYNVPAFAKYFLS